MPNANNLKEERFISFMVSEGWAMVLGQNAVVTGGWWRTVPHFTVDWMHRMRKALGPGRTLKGKSQ